MDIVIAVIILILTVLSCLPIFKNYQKRRAISKCIDHLPGEKKYPIIGTTINAISGTRETFWEIIKDRHIKFGPIFRSWIGSIPVVHIYKPEHAQIFRIEIYGSQSGNIAIFFICIPFIVVGVMLRTVYKYGVTYIAQIIFKSTTNINKGYFYKFFIPFLGGGLISGNLPKWRHHRKFITPAFHLKVIESYAETFSEKGDEFARFLDKFSGKGYVEITQYLTQLSVDVLCETAMGVKLNFLKTSESKYGDAMSCFLNAAFRRINNPLLHNDFLCSFTQVGRDSKKSIEYIRTYNKEVINQRKEYLEKNKSHMQKEDEFGRKEKMSFLDVLLTHQDNNNFTYEEIEEEVNTFMFAGQDTSAATVSWALMVLGNNPDIITKVQDELDAIYEDDPDRKVTIADIAQMNYLDMVIKEVLRYSSFVPYLGRHLVEDVVIDGVRIPKGANVIVSLYDLHHDANHYPDPWKFDPDRFLPENVENRHPFAFVPFSAGARNCIGQKFGMQNIKTIMAYICRRHNIRCEEKQEDLKFYLEIVLRPQNGVHIAIEPRQRSK